MEIRFCLFCFLQRRALEIERRVLHVDPNHTARAAPTRAKTLQLECSDTNTPNATIPKAANARRPKHNHTTPHGLMAIVEG